MATIKDAGQELAYNRRNRDKGLRWEDIAQLDPALRASSTTKAKVWPKPNYEELIEQGMHPMSARVLKTIYDSLGAKPLSTKDEHLEGYIDSINRIKQVALDWAQDKGQLRQLIDNLSENLAQQLGIAQTEQRAINGQQINVMDLLPTRRSASAQYPLLTLLWPQEMAKPSGRWRGSDSDAARELRLIGGNRTLSKLQPSPADFAEMVKELRDGWPAKKPAWQVQGYKIVTKDELGLKLHLTKQQKWMVVGARGRCFVGGMHDSEASAQQALDNTPAYLLLNKHLSVVAQHDSEQACIEAAQNAATKRQRLWEPDKSEQQLVRIGPQWRTGNVTADDLMSTFGFKGVNYGNWVPDAERQHLTNASYDSFMDLADALQVDPEEIGQHGMLGLAIGAQGSGKFAGHFVPGLNEINETRFSSGGVASHEWGHFVDHLCAKTIFADDARGANAYLSDVVAHNSIAKLVSKYPEHSDLICAMHAVWQKLSTKEATLQEVVKPLEDRVNRCRKNARGWWSSILRSTQADQLPADQLEVAKQLIEPLIEKGADRADSRQLSGTRGMPGYLPAPLCDAAEKLMSMTGKRIPSKELEGLCSNLSPIHRNQPGGDIYARVSTQPGQTSTHYLNESKAMDGLKGGEQYWSTPREMFARAFADWTRFTLAEQGRENSHLAQNDHAKYEAAKALGLIEANPFLSDEELPAAAQAISQLIEAMPLQRHTQNLQARERQR